MTNKQIMITVALNLAAIILLIIMLLPSAADKTASSSNSIASQHKTCLKYGCN